MEEETEKLPFERHWIIYTTNKDYANGEKILFTLGDVDEIEVIEFTKSLQARMETLAWREGVNNFHYNEVRIRRVQHFNNIESFNKEQERQFQIEMELEADKMVGRRLFKTF